MRCKSEIKNKTMHCESAAPVPLLTHVLFTTILISEHKKKYFKNWSVLLHNLHTINCTQNIVCFFFPIIIYRRLGQQRIPELQCTAHLIGPARESSLGKEQCCYVLVETQNSSIYWLFIIDSVWLSLAKLPFPP